jgi:predicted MFS family arabinose efflux permease
MSEAIIDYSFWLYDRIKHPFPNRFKRVLVVSRRQKSLQHAALTAGLWVGFFTGAFCGAVAVQRFALFSLLAPMGVLTVAAIVDIVRPAAAADEPEATESAH